MIKIKLWFNIIFPYLAVLILWRLHSPFWNPGGCLAIIPIFYYSFIHPRNYFWIFAIFGCFLLDSSFDTLLMWTMIFSVAYTIAGFQNYIDLTRQNKDGFYIFLAFFGIVSLLFGIIGAATSGSFSIIFRATWMFILCSALYIPFSLIAERLDSR